MELFGERNNIRTTLYIDTNPIFCIQYGNIYKALPLPTLTRGPPRGLCGRPQHRMGWGLGRIPYGYVSISDIGYWLYIYIYIYMYIYAYVFLYVYIYREREISPVLPTCSMNMYISIYLHLVRNKTLWMFVCHFFFRSVCFTFSGDVFAAFPGTVFVLFSERAV